MKPFIGFDTGVGASLRMVHWAVAADEAVAGRAAHASPAVAARAMVMRVNVLIARSFQSVLRLGTLRRGRVAWDPRAASVCAIWVSTAVK